VKIDKRIGKLGKGSFVSVYLLEDPVKKIHCALKEIKLESLIISEKRISEMIKKLNYPEIVKILDTFTEGEKYYILMEYCEQGSLNNFIESERKGEGYIKENVYSILLFFCDVV
jgi:serine/threonine protein kinase